MLQVLEAAIAILILLSSLIFVSFEKHYSINLNIEEIRKIVYTNPRELCKNFTFVKIINLTNNSENISCSGKYTILVSYLFIGNETNYNPVLVIFGR